MLSGFPQLMREVVGYVSVLPDGPVSKDSDKCAACHMRAEKGRQTHYSKTSELVAVSGPMRVGA